MATKKKSYKKVGARAGKADLATKSSGLETSLTGSKFQSGGAKMKAKKGGIVRKPLAKIRYKKTTG
jgi:hypothetical protein|tara:strand:- start:111 stop:308 length:198 start_codon:yes stop_codon:yes gene_type:complete